MLQLPFDLCRKYLRLAADHHLHRTFDTVEAVFRFWRRFRHWPSPSVVKPHLASGRPFSRSRSALYVLHRRDRPSALVSSDGDAKPVLIVEEELIDCAGLSVTQADAPADQLLFGRMQFAEDVHGSLVAGARSAHEPRVLPFGSSSSSTRSPAGETSYLPSRRTSHPALTISCAVCTLQTG